MLTFATVLPFSKGAGDEIHEVSGTSNVPDFRKSNESSMFLAPPQKESTISMVTDPQQSSSIYPSKAWPTTNAYSPAMPTGNPDYDEATMGGRLKRGVVGITSSLFLVSLVWTMTYMFARFQQHQAEKNVLSELDSGSLDEVSFEEPCDSICFPDVDIEGGHSPVNQIPHRNFNTRMESIQEDTAYFGDVDDDDNNGLEGFETVALGDDTEMGQVNTEPGHELPTTHDNSAIRRSSWGDRFFRRK